MAAASTTLWKQDFNLASVPNMQNCFTGADYFKAHNVLRRNIPKLGSSEMLGSVACTKPLSWAWLDSGGLA